MTESTILTSIDDRGVATLTMNRPELHNAFDDLLIAELTVALQRLDSHPTVRVVCLTGNGKSFSAGADLNWMKRMAGYTREQNLADADALAGLMATLNNLTKPTIALVQGAAYGGGVGLVACCDIALGTRNSAFCLSEVKLGLIPAVISPYVVAAIGSRAARRYFLSAEVMSAAEACRLGLLHEVVDDGTTLAARAISLVDALLRNGPNSMAEAKRLVATVSAQPLGEELIKQTACLIADQRSSAEGREGVAAFLDKRQPAWIK